MSSCPHPKRRLGIACVMFAVLVWSGWVITSRYSVQHTLSAYDIAALRFGVAALLMLPVMMRKGWKVGPWGIWSGIFLAFMMGAPYNVVAIMGMKFAPVSHAALIQTSMLIFVSILSITYLKEQTDRLRIFGIALSVTGILILVIGGDAVPGGHAWLGHLLFLTGGLMWSFYAVALKRWGCDALHASAAVCVYSGLIYVPIYLLFLPHQILQADMREVAFQAIYQGVINSVFALLCFNRSVAILGAATSSAFLPLVTVISTVAAIPLLNEMPGAPEWLGIAVATVGVMMATGIATRMYLQMRQKSLGT